MQKNITTGALLLIIVYVSAPQQTLAASVEECMQNARSGPMAEQIDRLGADHPEVIKALDFLDGECRKNPDSLNSPEDGSVFSTLKEAGQWVLDVGKKPVDFVLLILGKLLAYLSTVFLIICKAIYDLAGILVNYIMQKSLRNEGIDLNVIQTMWALVRDFANLGLIFILLYISVQTVLGLASGKTLNTVAKVILVGLAINFSLVLTQVVIDTSNVIALEFLRASGIDESGSGALSMSASIDDALKIDNLYQSKETLKRGVPDTTTDASTDNFTIAMTRFGTSIFLIIAALVLLIAAGMFVVRVLILSLVMISAPIAFISTILPATSKTADKWWNELISASFFAPVFLFMFYISLNVIRVTMPDNITYDSVVNWLVTGGSGGVVAGGSVIQLVSGYTMAIALLVGSILAANNIGGRAAAFGSKLSSSALGTGAGVTAFAGRRYIGGLGQRVSEAAITGEGRILGVDVGSRIKSINEATGGALKSAADYTKSSSFDIRAAQISEKVPGIGGTKLSELPGAGLVGSTIGLAPGTAGGAGGYAAEQARAKKEAEDKEKAQKAEEKRILRDREVSAAKTRLNTPPDLTNLNPQQIQDVEKQIQKDLKLLNEDEILELVGTNMADPAKQHLIRNLNSGQLKAVNEKGGLDDANKKLIRTAVENNKDNNKDGIKYYAEEIKKEAEKKMAEEFRNFAAGITGTTTDDEIRTKILNLSPNVVVRPEIKSVIMSGNPRIRANLSGRALNSLITDAVKGGDTTVDDIIKIDQAISGNTANAGGNKVLQSKRVKELLGRA